MKELIIERAKLQTVYQRYTSITLTVFFWIVWIYIWTPLVTVAFWWFGIGVAYTDVFTYTSFKLFMADVGRYFITISIFCAVLIFWAVYNFLRFRNTSRREEHQAVSLEEISNYANIKKESLVIYQKTKILSVRFDEQNKLVDIRELETPLNILRK